MEEEGEWIDNECVLMVEKGKLELQRSRLQLDHMEPGSVLLRTEFAEVCGTDVHLLHGRLDLVQFPIIPGHVGVGRVHSSVGPVHDVAGVPIAKGDLVTFLDVVDTCNSCITCLVDKQSTRCPHRRVIGITCSANAYDVKGLLGCWSSFIYLPPNTKVIRLPTSLPPEKFMGGGCGLPTALHAVDRAGILLMDRVVVQGSGPVGLLAAILARFSGASQVIVIGAPAHRLAVVEAFGISATINIQEITNPVDRQKKVEELTEGHCADVVIEATGRPEAIAEGLALCKNGGTYVVVGQYTDNGDVSINPHLLINRKHIVIKGCWGSDFSHFYRGVQFMDTHADLPWDLVVSTTVDLKSARQALESVERLEVFKALIRPEFPSRESANFTPRKRANSGRFENLPDSYPGFHIDADANLHGTHANQVDVFDFIPEVLDHPETHADGLSRSCLETPSDHPETDIAGHPQTHSEPHFETHPDHVDVFDIIPEVPDHVETHVDSNPATNPESHFEAHTDHVDVFDAIPEVPDHPETHVDSHAALNTESHLETHIDHVDVFDIIPDVPDHPQTHVDYDSHPVMNPESHFETHTDDVDVFDTIPRVPDHPEAHVDSHPPKTHLENHPETHPNLVDVFDIIPEVPDHLVASVDSQPEPQVDTHSETLPSHVDIFDII